MPLCYLPLELSVIKKFKPLRNVCSKCVLNRFKNMRSEILRFYYTQSYESNFTYRLRLWNADVFKFIIIERQSLKNKYRNKIIIYIDYSLCKIFTKWWFNKVDMIEGSILLCHLTISDWVDLISCSRTYHSPVKLWKQNPKFWMKFLNFWNDFGFVKRLPFRI